MASPLPIASDVPPVFAFGEAKLREWWARAIPVSALRITADRATGRQAS